MRKLVLLILTGYAQAFSVPAVAVSPPLPTPEAPQDFLTGTEEKPFDWYKQWYPIAVPEYLDPGRPQHVQLLGKDLVIWKDKSETWNAFEDKCPHRLVPLSEGRVEDDGTLLCAYHAWRFDGSGACVDIPQSSAKAKEQHQQMERACATKYPTMEAQELLWVWPVSGPLAFEQSKLRHPLLIPELEDKELMASGRVVAAAIGIRDLPYGYDTFLDNVLDPAHVAVAHHGIMGSRYTDAKPVTFEKGRKATTQDGFSMFSITEDKNGKLSKGLQDFSPPCRLLLGSAVENNDEMRSVLALYAVPTKPGWCRNIGRQILIKDSEGNLPPGLGIYAKPLPKWLLHVTASLFLHQDMVFLHHQQGILDAQGIDNSNYSSSIFSPNGQDTSVLRFRRWLANRGGGGVDWVPTISRALPPREYDESKLFDVYHTHTKNCRYCKDALKNTQRGLKVLKAASLAAVAAGAYRRQVVPFALLAGICYGGHIVLEKLEAMFYTYPFHHQVCLVFDVIAYLLLSSVNYSNHALAALSWRIDRIDRPLFMTYNPNPNS
ncbi:unnamed protein product [Chrysoparadoxa australica]